MRPPQESPTDIPQVKPSRNTARGSVYASRIPKGASGWCQRICFDTPTAALLEQAQRLEQLNLPEGSYLSRTVIIRRAVYLYVERLVQDAQAGIDLSTEAGALLGMTTDTQPQDVWQP